MTKTKQTKTVFPQTATQKAEQKEKVAQHCAQQAEDRKACIADKKPLAPLVEAFEQKGVDGLVHAFLQGGLPLHSSVWSELRRLIPFDLVDYQRDGCHLYGLYGDPGIPDQYLPNNHPVLQLVKPTRRHKAVQTQLLCSICGHPIRANVRTDARLVLTLCPKILPEISGPSGWVVRTINLGKVQP